MIDTFKKIEAGLVKLLSYIISFLLLAMMVLVVIQVVCRYFLHISTPWSEEFARLAMVWAIFIAASLAVRMVEHPRVDVLFSKMPDYIRLIVELVICTFMIAMAVVMIIYGARLVKTTANDFTTSLQYHRNLFYWPVPVSGVLITAYSIKRMIESILCFKSNKKNPEQA